MPLPSLSQARDVITTFLSKLAAKDEHMAPALELDYVPVIARTLATLLRRTFSQEARERMQDDPEMRRFIENGARDLVSYMSKQMSENLSHKLNRSVGAQTHTLYKATKGRRKPQPVAKFSGRQMSPGKLYERFSTILKKDGIDMTAEQVKQQVKAGDYSVESRDIPVYDARDLKTNSTVQIGAAIEMLVDVFRELLMDPSRFQKVLSAQSEMTEEKAEAIESDQDILPTAVAWMRPPAGKTFSGSEEEEKSGKRPMDPRIGKLLMTAKEEGRPVRWEFRNVRTEGGRKGGNAAFNMLDFVLPEIGEKEYSVKIPDEIAKGIRDQRPGEVNHFDVLDYNEGKGFKVRFKEHLEGLRKSMGKSIMQAGTDVQTLHNALNKAISDHAKAQIGQSPKDMSEVAEQYLGRVMVNGKDIASPGGLDAVLRETEERLTAADPRGGGPTQEAEEGKNQLRTFVEQKEQESERVKKHEEFVGEEISKAMGKGDQATKIADKLADMIARQFPEKAPFTSDSRTWNEANAFRSKDTVRWLVKTMVDSALLPTPKGAVRWNDFLRQLFESDILADPDLSQKLFGSKSLNDFFKAMKLALLMEPGKMSSQEKQEAYAAYHSGSLTVTPQERRQIVEKMSSKESDAIRMSVSRVQNDLKNAFIELYRHGDPDAEKIVNMSHVNLSETVTKKEKEERGLDPSKRVKRESLRPQMESLRQREKDLDDRDEAYVRDVERLLVDRKFDQASKMLESKSTPKRALKRVMQLSGMDYVDQSSPQYEKAMELIESVSDDLERSMGEEARERRLKAVGEKQEGASEAKGRKPKKVEEAVPVQKEATYLQIVKMAMTRVFES